MSKTSKTTVIIKEGETYRRLAKVFFGSDGSYYSTVPYHSSGKACLLKMTVNYDAGTRYLVSPAEILDMGSLDDRRIKLSHHPDGFVQFSGDGVLSGRNEDGSVKGMGVLSSPLDFIFDGPSFSYCIQDLGDLERIEEPQPKSLVLDVADYYNIEKTNSITVEAHYFVPMWRRFIRHDHRGHPVIRISHPCRAVLELRVFAAPVECDFPGFLGFELYRHQLGLPNNGYSFGGPAEKMRLNEYGQRVADAMLCVYPRHEDLDVRRSFNFPQPFGTEQRDEREPE